MSKMKTALLTVALIGSASATAASATTIDFNSNPNNTYFVDTVTSNGFLATENLVEDGQFRPMGTNVSVDGVGHSNVNVHLDSWTNNGYDSIWTLSQVNREAFSLNAFDFASAAYFQYAPATLLTLTGTRIDNSTVTQTFTPIPGGFQTFMVSPAFSNVKFVQFDAFGYQNRSAYDNIVVGAATGAVPEPATWAMMLAGVGLMGFAKRRRSKNVTTTVAYAA